MKPENKNNTENPEEVSDTAICSASGELIVWEEEGGYGAPYFGVSTASGEVSLEDLMTKLLPKMEMNGGKQGVEIKVTLEIIKQNA